METRHSMHTQRAFTILELMIVVVIAGVLAAIAAPNMRELVLNNQRTARINSFVTALNIARSEAIKLNAPVSVCTSGTGGSSGGTGQASKFERCNNNIDGQFEDGWLVFADTIPANNPNQFWDNNEIRLRNWDPDMNPDADKTTPPTLRGKVSIGGAIINGFTYLGTGFPLGGAPGTAHIVYCDSRGPTSAMAIVFGTTGQPRVIKVDPNKPSSDTNNNQIVEINGVDVQCT